jgi:hypothetical protein
MNVTQEICRLLDMLYDIEQGHTVKASRPIQFCRYAGMGSFDRFSRCDWIRFESVTDVVFLCEADKLADTTANV